jgi:hypothetical protein
MKNLLACFLIIGGLGAAIFGWGSLMSPMRDSEQYSRRYMELAVGSNPGRSAEFYRLREEHLTPAYKLQDYGLSFLVLSAYGLIGLRWMRIVSWLSRGRIRLFIFGLITAGASVATYVGSLYLDMHRGVFPMWGDSLGIPLMGAPILLILAILWMALNWALFVPGRLDKPRVVLRGVGWFFGVIAALTCGLFIWSLATGDFWSVIGAPMWLLLYLVVWCSRVSQNA